MRKKFYDVFILITFFLGIISIFCFAVQLISLGMIFLLYCISCSVPIVIYEVFLKKAWQKPDPHI